MIFLKVVNSEVATETWFKGDTLQIDKENKTKVIKELMKQDRSNQYQNLTNVKYQGYNIF